MNLTNSVKVRYIVGAIFDNLEKEKFQKFFETNKFFQAGYPTASSYKHCVYCAMVEHSQMFGPPSPLMLYEQTQKHFV